MKRKSQENFIEFIKNCPTSFHTSSYIAQSLKKNGFIPLEESKSWDLEKSKGENEISFDLIKERSIDFIISNYKKYLSIF